MYIAYLNFFFNDTATTEIYTYGHTLSLHDALPILHLVAEGLGDGIVLGHASIRCPALLEGDHVGVELLAGLDDVEGREPLAAPAAAPVDVERRDGALSGHRARPSRLARRAPRCPAALRRRIAAPGSRSRLPHRPHTPPRLR